MFSQLSISRKFALLAAIFVFITGAVIHFLNQQQLVIANENLANQIGNAMASQLAANATNDVITDDKLALQTMLQQFRNTPIINYAAVLDATDVIVVESGNAPLDETPFQFKAEITVDDGIVGHAHISLNQAFSPKTNNSLINAAAIIGLAIISFYLSNLMLKPFVRRLTLITGRINGVNKAGDAYLWQDELGELEQATQTLLPKLYREPPVEQPPRAVMVMQAAQLTENSSKEALVEISSELKKIVSLYGGNFHAMGDITTIIFDQSTNNSFQALCAGILVREVMMALSDRYTELSKVSIGIDSEAEESADDRSQLWQQHLNYATELATANKGVSLSHGVLSCGDISAQISVSESREGFRLKSVKKELKELLEQQLSQLLPNETEQ
ncbi:MAG: putative membrane protein affecting hemolysin expression [Pseudomonadales bacterium]|jgi:uncharacterized membrane protein affecting hemolysin expression